MIAPVECTASFAARVLSDGSHDPARLRLLHDGAPFGPVLNGSELVAVYGLDGGDRLVFTHEGVTFEEAAHVHWLDGSGTERGRAHVGRPYATGALRDLAPDGSRAVSFGFFGGDRWRVEARPGRWWRRAWHRIGGPPSLHLVETTG